MTKELEVQNLDVVNQESKLADFLALSNYQVTDQATYDYAVLSVKNGREFIKEIEEDYDPRIATLYRPYKDLLDEKNKYIKPTDAAIQHLSHVSVKWQREERNRLEAEHQKKLAAQKEQERLQLEEAKKKAEAEFDFFADPLPAPPVPLVPVTLVAQAPPPKVSTPLGMGIKESPLKWRWKDNGQMEFIKACAEDPRLLYYVGDLLDQKVVKALMSKGKELAEKAIPGIECYRDEILARK